jgi:NADH-quinone oxidoreductase subunit J
MPYVAFFLVAALALGAALGLVLKKNAIHGALFLVVNLGSIAALYLMLGAEFLAAAQIIVYAGAIMVLFVFAIMVLIPGKEETGPDPRRAYRMLALPVAGVLLLEVIVVLVARMGSAPRVAAPPTAGAPAAAGSAAVTGTPAAAGSVEALGRVIFTDYLVPFELTSVLLLAAMVGVLLLARRRA